MTKAQAISLMTQLETAKLGASAVMQFDAAGNESWNVQLDTRVIYTGAQIAALQNYCQQNALTMSLGITSMGVT